MNMSSSTMSCRKTATSIRSGTTNFRKIVIIWGSIRMRQKLSEITWVNSWNRKETFMRNSKPSSSSGLKRWKKTKRGWKNKSFHSNRLNAEDTVIMKNYKSWANRLKSWGLRTTNLKTRSVSKLANGRSTWRKWWNSLGKKRKKWKNSIILPFQANKKRM